LFSILLYAGKVNSRKGVVETAERIFRF
jgi:hypothetical protein